MKEVSTLFLEIQRSIMLDILSAFHSTFNIKFRGGLRVQFLFQVQETNLKFT